jgi:hypothetical protein
MKLVAILQNAWSPVYAGGHWPRESWLRALRRSRSGQRLDVFARAAGDGVEIYFDNTTPIVGATPDSIVAADLDHVRAVVERERPDVVVAFGRLATAALDAAGISATLPTLALPHPAARVVTNDLFRAAGELVKLAAVDGPTIIRQGRGFHSVTRREIPEKV